MAFDSANTYASVDDLKLRLSRRGYTWAGDVDDADGFIDASSAEATYAEEALDYANGLIDEALTPHADITPRPANGWLKDRCVDIAAARYFSLGGRKVPKPLADDAQDARDRLVEVREGLVKVPGLISRLSLGGGRPYPVRALNIGC